MPGRPASRPHTAGATTPSEKFSARLSMAARITAASSSVSGIAADDVSHGASGRRAGRRRAARRRPRRRRRAGCAVQAAWRPGRSPAATVATRPAQPPGRRSQAGGRQPPAVPRPRRTAGGRPSRFRVRSSQPISAPAQTTGCRMARNSALGVSGRGLQQQSRRDQAGERDGVWHHRSVTPYRTGRGRRDRARGPAPCCPAAFPGCALAVPGPVHRHQPRGRIRFQGCPPDAFTRLPEPEELDALQAAAATAYGVRDPAMVVAAPGTQVLISLLAAAAAAAAGDGDWADLRGARGGVARIAGARSADLLLPLPPGQGAGALRALQSQQPRRAPHVRPRLCWPWPRATS